jgi:hypothetical protein
MEQSTALSRYGLSLELPARIKGINGRVGKFLVTRGILVILQADFDSGIARGVL